MHAVLYEWFHYVNWLVEHRTTIGKRNPCIRNRDVPSYTLNWTAILSLIDGWTIKSTINLIVLHKVATASVSYHDVSYHDVSYQDVRIRCVAYHDTISYCTIMYQWTWSILADQSTINRDNILMGRTTNGIIYSYKLAHISMGIGWK